MKKTILISIIFGLITIALIFVGISPLLQGIKKNSETLIALKAELTLSQERAGKIEQLKKDYKELEPDLEKIDKLFVNPETPIDLIEFWEKMASISNLSIEISPVSLKSFQDEAWNSMGFQLRLTGSFPNFRKFLEKIETGPYLIELQNLSVKKLTEGKLVSPEDVSVSLTAKVYTR